MSSSQPFAGGDVDGIHRRGLDADPDLAAARLKLTAARQRAAARAEYDAFLAACPSRQVLARISDK